MQPLLRALTIFGLLAILSACGFHLRGDIQLPLEWRSMHLSSPSPNSELTVAVRNTLAANNVIWSQSAEGNYVLYLDNEHFSQRNLSIGGNARAVELELTLTTNMSFSDATGQEILPISEIKVFKIMEHDAQNITGKAEESRLLRREMRAELVQHILRRLRFLAIRSKPEDHTD